MRRVWLLLFLLHLPLAQAQRTDAQAASNTVELLKRIEDAPRLDFTRGELPLKPPNAAWAVEMVSSVAAGPEGITYVLQRGPDADPVLAVDRQGRIQRSWGAGLYMIPHSIRVDPSGNVWTVDAGSSHIYQFSPQGEQLLHIDVGEMPDKKSPFRGATDIAFAANGNLLVADGYGNARILEAWYPLDSGDPNIL